ncbi:MAG: hypothetical protein ACI9U2_002688 [Bradymonadia bacterium]|jgi:hypothetical protein
MFAALRFWGLVGIAAGASLGCSFVIDLEGPSFVEVTYTEDVGLPPAVDATVIVDAAPIDGRVPIDAGPQDAAVELPDMMPMLPEFELTLSAAAPVIVHSPNGEVRAKLDQSDTFRVVVFDGEAVTARFGDATLVSLTGLQVGGTAPISRPMTTTRTATMRARLPSPYPTATGYVMTNGCRNLSCIGEECLRWLEGELSLSVTNACAPGDVVRTLAIATLDGQPIGWMQARDPFPESANAEPGFGEWQDDFVEVTVHATGVEMPDVHGLPWAQFAFDTDIAPRRTETGRLAVLVPESFSEVAEFGLDINPPGGGALGRSQQGMRSWRRTEVSLPVVLEARRLPPVPRVVVEPDADGARPTIRWTFDDDALMPAGLARVEFNWDTEDASVQWILFADAAAGQLRLPHLPMEWAALSPPAGTLGRAAQVTIVQCLGNESLSDHYADPCPVYGPGKRDATVQDVRWSAGFIEGGAEGGDVEGAGE